MRESKIYSIFFGRYMTIQDIRKEINKAYINQDYQVFEITMHLEQKLFSQSK